VRKPFVIGVLFLAAFAVGVRLWLAWSFYGNYDQESFEVVRGIVNRGGNVYAETVRYNYSPVWFILLGVFGRISDATGLPFQFVIRATLTLVDIATALLVLVAARRLAMPPERAAIASVLFLANPVSIAVTGFHGQFDNLALLFVVAALVVQLEGPRSRAATVLLGIGVIVKQTVAPLVLFVLSGSVRSPPGRLRAAIVIGIAFFLTLVPFAFAPDALVGILTSVFAYGAYAGWNPGGINALFGVLRVTVLASAGLLAHRLPLHRAAALGGILLAATAGPSLWNSQYLVLPLALAALAPSPMYFVYTAAAMLSIAQNPEYLNLGIAFDWRFAWAVAVGWAAEFVLISIRTARSSGRTAALEAGHSPAAMAGARVPAD
jgi:hypothetical protein